MSTHLDLFKCIFVTSEHELSNLKEIGLKGCSSSEFFRNSGWSMESKLNKFGVNFSTNYPPFLKDIKFFQNEDLKDSQEDYQVDKLYLHMKRLQLSDRHIFSAEERGGIGRSHLIVERSCFPKSEHMVQMTNIKVEKSIMAIPPLETVFNDTYTTTNQNNLEPDLKTVLQQFGMDSNEFENVQIGEKNKRIEDK